VLLFNFVMYCIASTIVVTFEISTYLSVLHFMVTIIFNVK